jgi:hypothetical protein
MGTWEVYCDGALFDVVCFESSCTDDYVKQSLVDHDGYDPNIEVFRIS